MEGEWWSSSVVLFYVRINIALPVSKHSKQKKIEADILGKC